MVVMKAIVMFVDVMPRDSEYLWYILVSGSNDTVQETFF